NHRALFPSRVGLTISRLNHVSNGAAEIRSYAPRYTRRMRSSARRLVCARRIEVYSRLLGELMGAKYFGSAVKRREDPRFLRGEARYVDDVKLAGMLHAASLRSPRSHARILAIHAEAARALPGVAAVFTFVDLERWMKPLPIFGAPPPGL